MHMRKRERERERDCGLLLQDKGNDKYAECQKAVESGRRLKLSKVGVFDPLRYCI